VILELDHVFCFVDPAGDWAQRANAAGFVLDDGIEHAGQGTRNRRLWFAENYVEFLWISSPADAAANPLHLDRRTCPFGIGAAGSLDDKSQFWAYHPPYAPGATIWIHHTRDDEPFVFAHDATPEQIERYTPSHRLASTPQLINPGAIREIRLRLPTPPPAILDDVTPKIVCSTGEPSMEIVLGDGEPIVLDDRLAIRR
jgi:hypothetical protein